MPELRELQRKLDSVRALGEVVGAMRNLAAIYVRRAEHALDAVRPYSDVVETCLDVLLSRIPDVDTPARPPNALSEGRCIAVVFASDQGLCGTFNDKVVQTALSFRSEAETDVDIVAIGQRGHDLLVLDGLEPIAAMPSPTSLEAIRTQVPEIAADIYDKYGELDAARLVFIYNAYDGMGKFKPTVRQVLPPRRENLSIEKAGSFSYDPILTSTVDDLLGSFVEEYFFIELYRALFESHTSENGARLMSMTSAASNIDDHTSELTHEFQSARQDMITSELLDVVGGAEALRE